MFLEDVERCLTVTGVDAVMSSEMTLCRPDVFRPAGAPRGPVDAMVKRYGELAAKYEHLVSWPTSPVARTSSSCSSLPCRCTLTAARGSWTPPTARPWWPSRIELAARKWEEALLAKATLDSSTLDSTRLDSTRLDSPMLHRLETRHENGRNTAVNVRAALGLFVSIIAWMTTARRASSTRFQWPWERWAWTPKPRPWYMSVIRGRTRSAPSPRAAGLSALTTGLKTSATFRIPSPRRCKNLSSCSRSDLRVDC